MWWSYFQSTALYYNWYYTLDTTFLFVITFAFTYYIPSVVKPFYISTVKSTVLKFPRRCLHTLQNVPKMLLSHINFSLKKITTELLFRWCSYLTLSSFSILFSLFERQSQLRVSLLFGPVPVHLDCSPKMASCFSSCCYFPS